MLYKVPEGSEVQIGQLIAVTVEKGMDWKQAVIPTSTKPGAVAPSSAQSTAPVDAKPPSSEQYVYCDFYIILC